MNQRIVLAAGSAAATTDLTARTHQPLVLAPDPVAMTAESGARTP
jgi:hypothetical protein